MTRDIVQTFYEEYPYPNVQRFEKKRMENYAQPLLAAAGMKLADLKEKTILDVGCGTGEITCSMAAQAKNATGIDFSSHSIAKANALAKKFKLTNTHFEETNLFDYQPTKKYDIVTSFGVLHHTSHFEKGFNRIAQWTKPNGTLIVGFYHAWGGWEQRLQKKMAQLVGGNEPTQRLEWVEKRQGMKMNEHSKAFWADRIAHPREHYFRVHEIKKMFNQNGFEITGIQSHKPEWKVNRIHSKLDEMRFELELLLRRKRFVIIAGKKLE